MQNRKNEKKEALISAAITIVSRDGLERLTTKSVEVVSGVSERYIFLYFGSKDGLLKQTFDSVEKSCVANLCAAIRAAAEEPGTEARMRRIWTSQWSYLVGHAERTKFYIRYFYSEQFERFSREDHAENMKAVTALMTPCCRDGENAGDLLRYIYTTMLSSSLAAITGTSTPLPELCERIFRMLYQSVRDQLI